MVSGELDSTQENLKDEDDVSREHSDGISKYPANHRYENGKQLRTSVRLRHMKRTAERKNITIQKLSTVKDIKIQVGFSY